jgi:hypothetical protein
VGKGMHLGSSDGLRSLSVHDRSRHGG